MNNRAERQQQHGIASQILTQGPNLKNCWCFVFSPPISCKSTRSKVCEAPLEIAAAKSLMLDVVKIVIRCAMLDSFANYHFESLAPKRACDRVKILDNVILKCSLFLHILVLLFLAVFVAAVAEWYRYRTVASLSRVLPLKTRRVGQRCTLNLSRAETSSRWCGVVVREGVPAQVSSTSLDHGSKLRGPSPKALV
ncbi:uncharacterized protein TNCV_3554421 [Trichonephila clavipes]|nr:uncharacterized protein TNCV_3554421 [Trichonephila clavipes]